MLFNCYSQLFIPFLSRMCKPPTIYHYLLVMILLPFCSYYNLLTNAQYPLPINLILVSVVVMLFTYAFAMSMLLQNEDNKFASLQFQPSTFILNFFSVLFVIVYFMSYFIGLLLLKKTILEDYNLPCTSLFSISSLFFGTFIANYSFYRCHNGKSNKGIIISCILMGLLSGSYFAMYYLISSNMLPFSISLLIILSVVLYIYSLKMSKRYDKEGII